MRSLTILFSASFSVFTSVLFAQPASNDISNIKKKWLNIPYANFSPAEKLDIYLPNEGDGPFPVIISIHGGAFMLSDKADEQLNPMLKKLNRMSGEAIFSANI